MTSPRLFPVLATLLPALASATPVYNLWAGTPATVTALGTAYSATEAKASSSRNVGTPFAFAYARARTSAGTYEFQLVSPPSTAFPMYQLGGNWNVSRDGVLLCSQCLGYAMGYTSAPGKPFTISVDNGNYQLTTTITGFNDFY
jgi:hypothetical protein